MKAAIIGCGKIAKVHGAVLQRESGVALAAFADCIRERAQNYAKEFGVPGAGVYESYEEMIIKERPDVVHICTPHYLHVPMALFALEHGCHVFMEKPPGITRTEFDALCLAEQKSEKEVGLCFQNRYNQTTKHAMELVESGSIGRIKGARAFVTWSRNEAYYSQSGWRGNRQTEGGGALINQAVHTLDLLVGFLGTPVWTESSMANHHLRYRIEVEDTVEAYINFGSVSACFYATTAYSSDADVLLELHCEWGTVRIEGNQLWLTNEDGRREIKDYSQENLVEGKSYWGNGHDACIHDFYSSLNKGEPVRNSLASAADTFSLMMDVYQSADCHQRVWFGTKGQRKEGD